MKVPPFPTLQAHVSNADAVRQVVELNVVRKKGKVDRGAAGGAAGGAYKT